MYGNSVVKVRNGSQMILNMVMFRYFDTAFGSDAAGSTCATVTTRPIPLISFETQTFLEPSVIDFFSSRSPNNVVSCNIDLDPPDSRNQKLLLLHKASFPLEY